MIGSCIRTVYSCSFFAQTSIEMNKNIGVNGADVLRFALGRYKESGMPTVKVGFFFKRSVYEYNI